MSNLNSDLAVPERLHIVPVGYEYDRIVTPLRETDADRVILLKQVDEEHIPSFQKTLHEDLEAEGIETKVRRCDIFDLYESLGTIAESIVTNADDEVYVNLATGSKVTAIAGMIACMAEEATPYYPRADTYGPPGQPDPPEHPVARDVVGIDALDPYPIEKPSPDVIEMLDYIATEGPVGKMELFQVAQDRHLEFVENADPETPQSKYQLLNSHIIDPLQSRNAIEIKQQGRKRLITITSQGENDLEAFSYLMQRTSA